MDAARPDNGVIRIQRRLWSETEIGARETSFSRAWFAKVGICRVARASDERAGELWQAGPVGDLAQLLIVPDLEA